jgi:hypothetical protein
MSMCKFSEENSIIIITYVQLVAKKKQEKKNFLM